MQLNIKKILVPLDFSETSNQVAKHAGWLAAIANAEIILAHILPGNYYYVESEFGFSYAGMQEVYASDAEENLQNIAAVLKREYNVKTYIRMTEGKIATEIVDIANSEKVDIIVMGTHGAKGFEEILPGSNAQHLVSQASCPVITFQNPARSPGLTNIVLPIERSRHSREKVGITLTLGQLCQSTIHILGLLDNDDPGEYQKLQVVLDQVQLATEQCRLNYTRHTVKGDNLAIESMKYAESVSADLIVVLTEEESVLDRIDLGPLSRHIVNHSTIPVMSINPHYGNFEALDLTGAYQAY